MAPRNRTKGETTDLTGRVPLKNDITGCYGHTMLKIFRGLRFHPPLLQPRWVCQVWQILSIVLLYYHTNNITPRRYQPHDKPPPGDKKQY